MDDDWRLQIDPSEDAHADRLVKGFSSSELKHDLSDAYHNRVIVSQDGPRVFLYTGTREQAETSRKLVETLAQEHGWAVNIELRHWHPIAEDWEDPENPLPHTEAARQTEHAKEISAEDQEVRAQGYPDQEVRLELPTRHAAISVARQLRSEGFSPVRRWRYLVLGAADSDQATALAERLREEVPEARDIRIEGTYQAARAGAPRNPFAVFGGLGG
jgi:hypothetical protein